MLPELLRAATAGDAIVIGAAGTGKTTAVVDLIGAFVDAGGDPSRVLAVAATRRSATALRDRIALRVAQPTPGPMARTVASLAYEIARGAAVAAGRPAPRLRTGADEDGALAALIDWEITQGADGYWPDELDRSVRRLPAFRSELRAFQTAAIELGLDRSELERRPEWSASARLLDAVAAREPDALASVQIIAAAADALDRETVDTGIAARLQLLVVDDAQELTGAGLRLVRALLRRGVRGVALGDPDLASGGFRGAVPGGFLRLWEGIRPVDRIVLTEVHRHGAAIRAVQQRITGRIGAATSGTQRAAVAGRDGGTAFGVIVDSDDEQAILIARLLRERRVRGGVPWSASAVVVRSAAAAAALAQELRMLEVPAIGAGVVSARGDASAVRGLLLVLDVALGRVELDADTAADLLTGPVGRLDALGLRRVRVALRHAALAADRDESADALLVEALGTPGGFTGLDLPAGRRAAVLGATLDAVRRAAESGASIEELLWEAWSRSGLERTWGEAARGAGIAADESNRHLDAVVALFAAAARFVEQTPTGGAAEFIAAWQRAQLEEDTLAPRGAADAVLVGTPYAFLGREFDTVVITELEDGVWPDPRVRGSLLRTGELGREAPNSVEARLGVLHDELRQLASAAGRARELLVAVGSTGGDAVPSPFLRLFPAPPEDLDVGELTRAPFTLRGLAGRLRRELTRERVRAGDEPSAADRAAAAALARLAAERVPGADPEGWYGLRSPSTTEPLQGPDEEVAVSPSRVGTFRSCALHWAIEHLGGGSTTFATSLGSIVHDAAQHAEGADQESLLAAVMARWGELDFESAWQDRAARVNAEAFVRRYLAYARDAEGEGRELLAREREFELRIGRALVRGTIDRVERTADGTAAVVVDLKTGRETAYQSDASVEEHPQLRLYQLAIAEHAVPGIDAALVSGGARLVILSRSMARTDYVAPRQSAMTEETVAQWRDIVGEVADGMSERTFIASAESHCRDPHSYGPCAIHIVEAVSA